VAGNFEIENYKIQSNLFQGMRFLNRSEGKAFFRKGFSTYLLEQQALYSYGLWERSEPKRTG